MLIQFEGSGKWPQDVEALRRLKTAFYIKLGKLLQRQYSHTTVINPDHIDVLINGYVFRIVIANHREISAMKAFNVNGMIKFENTDQSKTLEMKIVTLPKITSVLHRYIKVLGELR